jgi:hypothetical protein
MRHGIGESRCSDGSIYKGSYVNDKKTGLGHLWFPDGDLYQGTF